ncbi:unnamed protein product [Medioppia subpectinata]|uniref:Phosphatidylinositol transfer protein N-terminal domain-containing protein n=1 Tax=Medioppia subpectinata TaxID=1979941 RepID=A0A7R9KLA1_9ACAR|nr:unnamed protein product [Medioppia subpectinata]CAG2105704.1 unnamed protein product [Medioppia subpectinata]
MYLMYHDLLQYQIGQLYSVAEASKNETGGGEGVEYQIGQLYSVAEASKNETGGGEGVEVLKNEPFDNYPLLGGKFTKGQYTKKIYHLASKVPALVKFLAGFPRELYNPDYMKQNFCITIETMHSPDRGTQENAHQLSPEKLKAREVMYLDIANDTVLTKDYKAGEDPTRMKSEKTGRGPLTDKNWRETVEPVMCAYKLVTVEFRWFGFQTKVESFIQKTERRIFLNFHRQVFCWIDRWHGLTMNDIRNIEEETKRELDENPDYMKQNFCITIETMHSPDRGTQENAHQLSPEKLKAREVMYLDIANDTVLTKDYKADEDPTRMKSEKTGRGPLTDKNWRETVEPVMCAYKLVTVEFRWFGFQTKVESFIQKTERRIFLNFHRQVFCWIDRWHGLTMNDIRNIEEQTRRELDEQRNQGAVRGTQNED